MRIPRVLVPALMFAALACAQQTSTQDVSRDVPKLIPVRYVNVLRLRDLVSIPGVSVKADEGMRVLVVSGRPDAVAAIEEMIKKLDVAPPAQPEFELTGYLVAGSIQIRPDDIPTDLVPAVKQLHALFNYKSYRIVDTFLMHGGGITARGMGQSPSLSGMLPGSSSSYDFGYYEGTVSGASAHFTDLRLDIHTPTGERNKEGQIVNRTVGIRASIDVPEGQKIVVGKSNYTGGDDALVLVLSVKIGK
jgi:hypothetical protein